ncbi:hypothetical protein DRQ53_10065 [bacterium]|nr:MAG: hypothetical protein DRQ53_10065 [bacterium]
MLRILSTALVIILCVLAVTPPSHAGKKTWSHQEYFESYEGTTTCLECHRDEAESFFHTRHYQWRGDSSEIDNADGEQMGKMTATNDFCTNPAPNWIGAVKNSDGQTLARGCSACHAGLGKMPEPELSEEQLENIDCLICHASGYRRDVYQNEAGEWEIKPILWKNQRGLDSVSKRISLPTRGMCLRCHSGAGGGPNFKRGDIEYEMAECDADFDVHMAIEGNDLQCIDCHAGDDHRIPGRGADLAGPDPEATDLSCSTCHDGPVHEVAILDHHTERVACTSCHIPTFAKANPTDMRRDWSTPQFHEEGNRFSATITFGSDVVPVYAWFNGRSELQKMGEEIKVGDDGKLSLAHPLGNRKDKQARIHPFKLHEGKLPVMRDKRWILPIAVEEFFADGELDHAVREAAEFAYGVHDFEYDWVETTRYMSINHEVVPAERALDCLECHREGGRMDWDALGYKKDPMLDHID